MIVVFSFFLSLGAFAHPGAEHGVPEPTQTVSIPTPLMSSSREEICRTDALLLIKYPISNLENTGWTRFCCGKNPVFDDGRCELDWPSSDVPSCDVWDEMRNQVYARYGFPFKGEKWRKWAKKQKWYERREDFQDSWLSPIARANIATLKRYASVEHQCQGKGK